MRMLALCVLAALLCAGSAQATQSSPQIRFGYLPGKWVPYLIAACTELGKDDRVGCTMANLENATIAVSKMAATSGTGTTYCVDFMDVRAARTKTEVYLYCAESPTKMHRFFTQ